MAIHQEPSAQPQNFQIAAPAAHPLGSWFERMGYDRPGGEEECAEMLDITVGHLRRLCRGQRFPSQELIKECRRLEEAALAEREREIAE